MIEKASHANDQTNIICQKLHARNIKAIAFIDDAYDPLTVDEISDAQVETFWAALQGREQIHEEMRQELNDLTNAEFGREVRSAGDIDGDVLLKLWESRQSLAALKEPMSQLFDTKLQKLRQVDRITTLIKKSCTVGTESYVEIKTLGSKDDVSGLGDASIVFIDYYLGPGNDNASKQKAVERANVITSEIYQRSGESKLPLVILMSSAPEVKEQQEQFSRDKGWVIGLFYCVTKDDLEDSEKLGINLGTWIERLEQGTKIQHFVQAVENSLDTAVGQLKNSLKNLSLEDYAYVQDFSLAPNGQPLGEYVLWLLNAYFGRLAFENDEEVRKHQDVISGFAFDCLPLNQFMPSWSLIEMYDSALFNKAIGNITHHPALIDKTEPSNEGTLSSDDSRIKPVVPGVSESAVGKAVADDGEHVVSSPAQTAEVKTATDAPAIGKSNDVSKPSGPLPYLRLGLIFVKDVSNLIWMVLNPDCDLAFTPDGKRKPTQVVALIGGKLEEMKEKKTVVREPKTDLFKWEDNTYFIEWQVKQIVFQDYRTLLDDLAEKGYTPHALLRLPYALDVQRAYAAHFTRVGMPVAPPIHHAVNVEILYQDEKNQVGSLLVPQAELAFLTTIRDPSQEGKMKLTCRVTTQFGHHLKRAIATLGDIYQQQIEALGEEEAQVKRERLGMKSARVKDLLKVFDELFLTNPSADLTGKDDGKLVSLYEGKVDIAMCRNLTNKTDFKQWQNYLVLVNVLDPDLDYPTLSNDEVAN